MTAATSTKSNSKELHLSLKERIEVVRSNRWFLMVFPFVMLALIIVIFGSATQGRFFQPRVLNSILSQAIIIGTCATGVAFIYSNGNLDISIGAVLGLAATLGVMVYGATGSVVQMIVVSVLAALALMAFNCTLSVVCHIKTITVAIVVTQIYGAISTLLIGGGGKLEISYDAAAALEDGGFRYIAFFAYFIFCVVIYHRTKVGRELRFLGGNENCAQQTGMSNAKATYISFLMTGLGVGLAAVFSVIDVAAVSVETGSGLGMDVMLATVLGGMSIFGGSRSNAYAGLIGALTVAALNKGLLMVGVSSALIQGIRGVIFLALVYLNSERQSLLPSRVQF
ncbi:putative ABC transporter, permease protein [uncultured Eubacteriales bacterium]|uniref:Putative ABC transporter, permease protein n=1 Tax=uncultured Eubacteriales bacterium TaxID=172733 RepID=A0A212JRT1_9FIRM|nr:putative ABC transporter, permease protein [uncultured Eubacteriales bacterium]